MRKFLFLIGVLLLIAGIFTAWFFPSAYIGAPAEFTLKITIEKDNSISDIALLLNQKGIITSAYGYQLFALFNDTAKRAIPGEYELSPGSSYKQIARQISQGPKRDEITLRFIEGQTLDDWQSKLILEGVSATSVSDLVGDTRIKKSFAKGLEDQFEFLKDLPEGTSLEGYLFPNTYRVWKDQLPLGIALKQLSEFENKTEGFAETAAAQGRTLHEVITLASIVEKEGRNPEERRNIARIFLNRLKIGMRLQSDATVNYVTGANNPRPTLDDLETVSAYNTYRNEGLPPGPICNPGKEALDAALNPADNNYYFYLHDEEGNIYYARNAEEHKLNRWKAYGE
ncbi:MAG: endolytic transglycosylase MltG [Patescibacteria group bacterium]|nr:endolytic transglycosylase MltG [Patescibacteria group bacterium]